MQNGSEFFNKCAKCLGACFGFVGCKFFLYFFWKYIQKHFLLFLMKKQKRKILLTTLRAVPYLKTSFFWCLRSTYTHKIYFQLIKFKTKSFLNFIKLKINESAQKNYNKFYKRGKISRIFSSDQKFKISLMFIMCAKFIVKNVIKFFNVCKNCYGLLHYLCKKCSEISYEMSNFFKFSIMFFT